MPLILTHAEHPGQGESPQDRRKQVWVLPHPVRVSGALPSMDCPQPRQPPATQKNGTPMPGPTHDPFRRLDVARRRRREAGLTRTLRPREAGSTLLDLAGNDYLGLARHPDVTAAAAEAATVWGAGATGSRLVTGSTTLHAELEAALARFCGAEAALVLASGYAANLAAVTALTDSDTLLVSDAHNHASLIDGCRLSRAETVVVPHAQPQAVRKALAGHPGPALVLTDSVFSVDGDTAPLAELAAACRDHGAALLIDDAHGLGVLGAGGRGTPHAARRRTRRCPGHRRHRHPVQGTRQSGRCRARSGPRHRPPGRHRPHVHLRHRPRAGRRRGGPRGPPPAGP